jgi:DNA-binding transcriptional ArsR family regulator
MRNQRARDARASFLALKGNPLEDFQNMSEAANEQPLPSILEYSNILIIVNSSLRTFKAQIFQALANPTRIAIVEALRDGELTAGALLALLGGEQSNLSQHLAVLRAKHVVASRKSGNQVYYALRDPVLIQVLDLLKQYVSAHLSDTLAMLGEMDPEHGRPA